MKTKDLMERVRFVVDPQGTQSGVLLNVEDWNQLLILLEDLEDEEEMQQLRKSEEEEISWEQAKAELGIS
jgi:PHD/YefM family antitoxin component YafN of YafNO toxin-antitoxin module